MKKLLFIASLVFISSQNIALYADTISFDQLAVSSDLTVQKYNADMNRSYQKINTNIQTDNIADDTLLEVDFSDEINPRIRTFEGAVCEKVDDGLLTTTTSGTLTGSVPAGTAYPRGFRCDKTSSTPKTFTASRWTFVDIDQSCNFQYSEVAIDAATPAIASNSIRISRVSTDGTEVTNVQDLRTTNCTSGPFEDISDASGEATLEDLLSVGSPVRNRGTGGLAQGLHISWDTHTTFLVKSGAVHINGKFRKVSSDITVPQTADAPTTGVSGIDTGAIAGSTRYNVFAVADQDAVKSYSITFSTATTPSGITNARKIGEITTDANSLFTSSDIIVSYGVQQRELVGSFIVYSSANVIKSRMNVSSLTDNGATGDHTITFDKDYLTANYPVVCTGLEAPATAEVDCQLITKTAGTVQVQTHEDGGAARDVAEVNVIAGGDIIK